VRADVSKAEELDKLYATVLQKLGKIDVLFANAGIYKFAPLAATTEGLYDETFRTSCQRRVFHNSESVAAAE